MNKQAVLTGSHFSDVLFYLCCTRQVPLTCRCFFPLHSHPSEGFTPPVRQPAIHKCAFLLCECLHRDFTHNDCWYNSILQQSASLCHLVQREIVNAKSMLLADTFITTPELNSCCKTHNLTVTIQLTQPVLYLLPQPPKSP